MTIGIVTPYFPDRETLNSGIANHYSLLAEGLNDLGYKVVIVHVRPKYENEAAISTTRILCTGNVILTYPVALPSIISKRIKNKGVQLDFFTKLACILTTARILKKVIKEHNITAIETSSYFSLCYLFLLKRRGVPFAIRVSTTFLQMIDSYYSFGSRLFKYFGLLELRFIKQNRFIITHANSHAEELEKLYNIPKEKFHIIPHGVNLPKKTTPQETPSSKCKILYVGRLEYRKGSDILLNAIPLVIKSNPNVEFEIIGKDPGSEYEQDFRQRNLSEVTEKVIFRGQVETAEMNEAYSLCDIFVAPSRYESFGLIYIEAMSYGKPVIGCNVGGVPEIIKDGFNGLFSDPESAEDLAEKILKLVNKPEDRLRLGSNARNSVEEKFTKEILAKKSVEYYKWMLKQDMD